MRADVLKFDKSLRHNLDTGVDAEIRAALTALLKEAPDGFDHAFDAMLTEPRFQNELCFGVALREAKEILEALSEGEAEDSERIQQAMSYVEVQLVQVDSYVEVHVVFEEIPTDLEDMRADNIREDELRELKEALLTVALRNVDEVEANAFTTLFWDAARV